MIEIVDEWPHLGHNRCDDDADIMSRRNCMVALDEYCSVLFWEVVSSN